MKREDYDKLESELSHMILMFELKKEIPREFMLRLLMDISQNFVPRFDETIEEWKEKEVNDMEEKLEEYRRKAQSWDDMRRRIYYMQNDLAHDIGVVAMNVMEEHDERNGENEGQKDGITGK